MHMTPHVPESRPVETYLDQQDSVEDKFKQYRAQATRNDRKVVTSRDFRKI